MKTRKLCLIALLAGSSVLSHAQIPSMNDIQTNIHRDVKTESADLKEQYNIDQATAEQFVKLKIERDNKLEANRTNPTNAEELHAANDRVFIEFDTRLKAILPGYAHEQNLKEEQEKNHTKDIRTVQTLYGVDAKTAEIFLILRDKRNEQLSANKKTYPVPVDLKQANEKVYLRFNTELKKVFPGASYQKYEQTEREKNFNKQIQIYQKRFGVDSQTAARLIRLNEEKQVKLLQNKSIATRSQQTNLNNEQIKEQYETRAKELLTTEQYQKWRRYNAMTMERQLVEKYGISHEQLAKYKELSNQKNKEIQLASRVNESRESILAKRKEINDRFNTKVAEVLTAEQFKRWKKDRDEKQAQRTTAKMNVVPLN